MARELYGTRWTRFSVSSRRAPTRCNDDGFPCALLECRRGHRASPGHVCVRVFSNGEVLHSLFNLPIRAVSRSRFRCERERNCESESENHVTSALRRHRAQVPLSKLTPSMLPNSCQRICCRHGSLLGLRHGTAP